jgi:hypothetical protein
MASPWPNHPSEDAQPAAGAWPDHPSENAQPPGTFGTGQDNLLPNAPYGFGDLFAHDISFGAADPIRAAMHAATDWGASKLGLTDPATGQPADRGYDFQRRWEEIARGRRQYEAENPGATLGAAALTLPVFAPARAASTIAPTFSQLGNVPQFLRDIWSAGPVTDVARTTAAAPSLPRTMATGAGIGGVGGAITGASDMPEDPLRGALQTAPIAGLLGMAAPVAGRVVPALSQAWSNLRNPAANALPNAVTRLQTGINRDIESGGYPSLAEAEERLTSSDAPLRLADIYPSVQRDVGALYDANTGAAPQIRNTIALQDRDAGDRLTNTLNATAVSGPHSEAVEAALSAQQRNAAGPAYTAFHSAPPINPDLVGPGGEITRILNTDAGQQAARYGQRLAANEYVDPTTMGYTFDADGNVQFTSVPSWRTLDYIKRGFDQSLSSYPWDPISGRRVLDTLGGQTTARQGDFVRVLDRENPLYADARRAWAGPEANKDALNMGQASLAPSLSAGAHNDQYDRLTPGQQQYYQLGQRLWLDQKLANTADYRNDANNLANTPALREKLRALFPDQASYDRFVGQGPASGVPGHVGDENTIFQTNTALIGNSATARRQGAMANEPPSGLAGAVVPAATTLGVTGSVPHAVAAGTLGAVMGPIRERLGQAAARISGNSPEAQRAFATLAMAPGPAARQVLGLLNQPTERTAAQQFRPGSAVAAQWAQLPVAMQNIISGLLSPQ